MDAGNGLTYLKIGFKLKAIPLLLYLRDQVASSKATLNRSASRSAHPLSLVINFTEDAEWFLLSPPDFVFARITCFQKKTT